jgi:sulfotransferase family protein
LIKLGISPLYHMREVDKNGHEDLWVEALEAKFENKGTPWTTQNDFDHILKDFEVIRLTLHFE